MNTKVSILLCTILIFANVSFADVFDNKQDLSYIMTKLPTLKDIRCKFNQDKYIEPSNIHLKSSGNFEFQKEKGIVFYTTYPVISVVSYKSSEYKQINNIIKAIAEKKYSRLEQDFDFYFQENENSWTLGLKPKNISKIADYITSIEISGNKDISQIILTTVDKTKTTIDFVQ